MLKNMIESVFKDIWFEYLSKFMCVWWRICLRIFEANIGTGANREWLEIFEIFLANNWYAQEYDTECV